MSNENKEQVIDVSDIGDSGNLQESFGLSTTGKIFFAAVAAYLAGKVASGSFLKLRGSPDELRAIADALVASKAFQDELKRPGATIDSVIEKMNLKNMTAAKFKQITGKSWPL